MRDPACVTWCSALDVAQAARCFGADPGAGVPMTFTDAEFEHYDEGRECVVIGSLDGWTLAIEPNGGEARSSGVLAALSRGGRALSLYWNGPVHVELNYAVQGRFVAEVPRSPVADWPAAIRDVVAPHLSGMTFPPDDRWRTDAFTLAARLSGTQLTDRWLETEHLRFVI